MPLFNDCSYWDPGTLSYQYSSICWGPQEPLSVRDQHWRSVYAKPFSLSTSLHGPTLHEKAFLNQATGYRAELLSSVMDCDFL